MQKIRSRPMIYEIKKHIDKSEIVGELHFNPDTQRYGVLYLDLWMIEAIEPEVYFYLWHETKGIWIRTSLYQGGRGAWHLANSHKSGRHINRTTVKFKIKENQTKLKLSKQYYGLVESDIARDYSEIVSFLTSGGRH